VHAWALSSNQNAKQLILIRCKHSQRAARSFVRGLEIRPKSYNLKTQPVITLIVSIQQIVVEVFEMTNISIYRSSNCSLKHSRPCMLYRIYKLSPSARVCISDTTRPLML
jgi:hypothetical protein